MAISFKVFPTEGNLWAGDAEHRLVSIYPETPTGCDQDNSLWTTFPCTSVSRKFRP
jgi:hypothetical protein